jgi:hypothetical protein
LPGLWNGRSGSYRHICRFPYSAFIDWCPPIDGEMSDFGIAQESSMISKSEIFDGVADGI